MKFRKSLSPADGVVLDVIHQTPSVCVLRTSKSLYTVYCSGPKPFGIVYDMGGVGRVSLVSDNHFNHQSLSLSPPAPFLQIIDIEHKLQSLQNAIKQSNDRSMQTHLQRRILSMYWEAFKLSSGQTRLIYWEKIKSAIAENPFEVLISHQHILFTDMRWDDPPAEKECITFLVDMTLKVFCMLSIRSTF